jgi:hypothetical protein
MAKRRYTILFVIIVSMLLLSGVRPALADTLDSDGHLLPGTVLMKITYGQGIYAAVADGGFLLTSPDARTWTVQTPKDRSGVFDVVYASGIFAATGPKGVALISRNGRDWFPRYSENTLDHDSIAYGDGKFVLVGPMPAEPHGISTLNAVEGDVYEASHSPGALSGVAYGNGLFAAVGYNGQVLTSSDGVGWQEQDIKNSGFNGITYGNGTFVAIGSIAIGSINETLFMTSGDGVTWSQTVLADPYGLRGVAYGNGAFVAVGRDGSQSPKLRSVILASPDGVTWTPQPVEAPLDLWGVSYCNGHFLAVGTGEVLSSPDGSHWTNLAPHTASFTPGQRGYVLDGQTYPTGAIPFISNGRLFVPAASLDATLPNLPGDLFSRDAGASPLVRDGATYLLARYVAETLGYTVTWDQASRTMTIDE